MKVSLVLQRVLVVGCFVFVTMLAGCVYHQQKSALEIERECMKKRIIETEAEIQRQTQINQDYEKKKRELEKEIADLQKSKTSLHEKLVRLQTDQERENKPPEETCGEKCNEIKELKKQIEDLEQSIEKKKSALGTM